jgi:hypothetical protein
VYDVGDDRSEGIGDPSMANNLFLRVILRFVFSLSTYTSSRLCRTFGKTAIACRGSEYTETYGIGTDQVQSAGEATKNLHRTNTLVDFVSQLSTTIYTQCGLCSKAIIVPSGQRRVDRPNGGFGYCLKCRTNIARCAIW